MYNTTFICTYPFYDEDLIDLNPISQKYKEEKGDKYEPEEDVDDDTRDYLYKSELLFALEIDEYNDEIMQKKIADLYVHVLSILENSDYKDEFKMVCKKAASIIIEDDSEQGTEEFGFFVFFAYDFFHIMHFALCELFERGDFTKETIDLLGNCVSD
jgi:hypothetical protein